MNKNKGFIGLGLIIAIVLGIVVVGGGAYYLGTKKNTKVVENTSVTNPIEENNSHEVPAGPYGDETNYVAPPRICNSGMSPCIEVISPNGGEQYSTSVTIKQIPVTWKSFGIVSKNVAIYIKDISTGKEDVSMIVPDSGVANVYGIPVGNYKIKICSTNQKNGNLEVTYEPDCGTASDYSDNSFTINSGTSASNIKTYTNKEFGIEFKYPSTANITESKLGRTDLGSGDAIIVSLPFLTHYDAWISKRVNMIAYNGSCSDYLPTSPTQKKIINGISYVFVDPDWGETSGMSSISKWRKYFYESADKCYTIEERLSGLGNNERPSTYTFPSDVDKFLNAELLDLDKIMASVKIY